MGQYYQIALKLRNRKNWSYYDRSVDGKYTMAKLTEHSWIGNECVDGIARIIEESGPAKLAWVGDYADREDLKEHGISALHLDGYEKIIKRCWADKTKYKTIDKCKEPYEIYNKILINLTKKEYVVMSKYVANMYYKQKNQYYKDFDWEKATPKERKSKEERSWEYQMVCHPLSILTALGNGKGGGDYYENNLNGDQVGRWVFDEIQIVNYSAQEISRLFSSGYSDITNYVLFSELLGNEKKEK